MIFAKHFKNTALTVTTLLSLSACGGTIDNHNLTPAETRQEDMARLYSHYQPFIEEVDLEVGPNKAGGEWQGDESVRPMVYNSAFDGTGTVFVEAGKPHLVKLFCIANGGSIFNMGNARSVSRYFEITPRRGELVTFAIPGFEFSTMRNYFPDCPVQITGTSGYKELSQEEADKKRTELEAKKQAENEKAAAETKKMLEQYSDEELEAVGIYR